MLGEFLVKPGNCRKDVAEEGHPVSVNQISPLFVERVREPNDMMRNDNKKFDTALIRDLAVLLDETNLSEIELEQGDTRIRVARQVSINAPVNVPPSAAIASAAPVASAPVATPVEPVTEKPTQSGLTVTSPMVGTAYLSPEPGTAAFIQVGDQVTEGQTILIIEAMKTMNNIPSTKTGTVKQILVDDAQPVEFGEPLIVVE